jgi:hypothetical protein
MNNLPPMPAKPMLVDFFNFKSRLNTYFKALPAR